MRNTLFLGGGNMAYAIIGGMIAKGTAPESLYVIDINPQARENIERLGVACSAHWPEHFQPAQVVLAVKPQVMKDALTDFSHHLDNLLLISIAAGIQVDQIRQWMNNVPCRIARTMPNTPALVGQGMTAQYFSPECSSQDQEEVQVIFSSCGRTQTLSAEEEINWITAISGSGPGYVFYLMEALETAAQQIGFDEKAARSLVNQTFLGAATWASQSDDSLATLREKVTSKGGTTFAGLEALRANQVNTGIAKAVQAALGRALEMQKGS
ncbi:MAG: pyrroline-5-carboxylate reductase [Limnobacter sp.]|nr:pyrroline-5-carboxylate reductase [Limnobacter sp.]